MRLLRRLPGYSIDFSRGGPANAPAQPALLIWIVAFGDTYLIDDVASGDNILN
jgi:hypothetical protein